MSKVKYSKFLKWSDVFREYRNATLGTNGSRCLRWRYIFFSLYFYHGLLVHLKNCFVLVMRFCLWLIFLTYIVYIWVIYLLIHLMLILFMRLLLIYDKQHIWVILDSISIRVTLSYLSIFMCNWFFCKPLVVLNIYSNFKYKRI